MSEARETKCKAGKYIYCLKKICDWKEQNLSFAVYGYLLYYIVHNQCAIFCTRLVNGLCINAEPQLKEEVCRFTFWVVDPALYFNRVSPLAYDLQSNNLSDISFEIVSNNAIPSPRITGIIEIINSSTI